MATVRIRQCPCRGCHGWLTARRHALTMRCACDECGQEFLVSWAFGFTEPWSAAPLWHRLIADASCRFEELVVSGEKKRTGGGLSPADFRMVVQEVEASKGGAGVLSQEEVETLLQSIDAPKSTKKASHDRMETVIAEGKSQRRRDATARVEETTRRLMKRAKPLPTKIIPRDRLEEERAKSVDEMLDATAAKKTKKGP